MRSLTPLREANAQRRDRAALAGVAAVREALSRVAATAPTHLVEAGRLRLAYPEASLRELAWFAGDSKVTKDVVASRLRRLLEWDARHGDLRSGRRD